MASEDDEKAALKGSSSKQADYCLLAPLAIVGLIDSISYMVINPSLIFYVLDIGGNKEFYGLIMSVFSFASFVFKPVLGYWADKNGSKFRVPYFTSLALAATGGALYFAASACSRANLAMAMIVMGRFLGGCGGANQALAFSYIALSIPSERLTQANAVMSMVRMFGMLVAPALNSVLGIVHFHIPLSRTYALEVTPLNSVGLFLMLANLLALVILYIFLKEPPSKPPRSKNVDGGDEKKGWSHWACIKSSLSMDVLLPAVIVFTMNLNFQLLETALAPAANHVLGWGPVGVSAMFGFNSFILLFVIFLTFRLSAIGVSDENLVTVGLLFSIVGYGMMYFTWARGSNLVLFCLPMILSAVAFPFLGSPTRSIFTRAVDSKECLRDQQGAMQAYLSMAASVAGFVAPGVIANYILLAPNEVDQSPHGRELTPWALYAPILSCATLLGFLCTFYPKKHSVDSDAPTEEGDLKDDEDFGGVEVNGKAGLLTASLYDDQLKQPRCKCRRLRTCRDYKLCPIQSAARRASVVTYMGITQVCPEDQVINGLRETRRHSSFF